jgi:hypothetical protein
MKALYKFIADSNVAPFLLRGLIKFTPIGELNDPSELMPHVIPDEVRQSLERLRRDGYTQEDMVNLRRQECLFQRLAPKFQVIRLPATAEEATALIRSPFYDQLSTLERRLSETALEISSKVGLFCLSLRYESLPMWAHYASNATGLVVEFVDLDTVFRGDNTGVLAQPIAIQYQRDRLSVTFDTSSHAALFFAKFADWSYEQEVRIVLPLADCRKESRGNHSLYICEIPRRCIARLILGWNMSNEARKAIQMQVQELNPEVELVNARVVHGRVELEPFAPVEPVRRISISEAH